MNSAAGIKPPCKKTNMLSFLESATIKLKERYIRDSDEDSSIRYIQVALVEDENVTKCDKNIEQFTKLTLQGQLDELLQRKIPLGDLRDIFCYEGKPCPQTILVVGGPGKHICKVISCVCVAYIRLL